jgi:hypothetical protein
MATFGRENERGHFMKANALYFPYINVPQSPWLFTMALYWDRISSIAPIEYADNPDQYSPFMRELLQAGLVQQVFPYQHIYGQRSGAHRFGETFIEYVESRLSNRVTRPNIQHARNPVKIHFEKLAPIAGELERLGVCRKVNHSWYEMVPSFATAYMAYLATFLGLSKDVDAQPLTDDLASYRMLTGFESQRRFVSRRDTVRNILLPAVLPTPSDDFDVRKLVRFKDANAEQLSRFRNRIENICIDLANRPTFNQEHANLKAADLGDEVEALAAKMKVIWPDIILRDVCPIVAITILAQAAPITGTMQAIATTASLVAAISKCAISVREGQAARNSPLAYAALAKKTFVARNKN